MWEVDRVGSAEVKSRKEWNMSIFLAKPIGTVQSEGEDVLMKPAYATNIRVYVPKHCCEARLSAL